MFGKFAKWVTQIDDPARIPELVGRAFHVAVNGRPGPVVVALPEDVLMERCRAPRRRRPSSASSRHRAPPPWPSWNR